MVQYSKRERKPPWYFPIVNKLPHYTAGSWPSRGHQLRHACRVLFQSLWGCILPNPADLTASSPSNKVYSWIHPCVLSCLSHFRVTLLVNFSNPLSCSQTHLASVSSPNTIAAPSTELTSHSYLYFISLTQLTLLAAACLNSLMQFCVF